MKKCPKCAEKIQAAAKVCKHCGAVFSEADVIASEQKAMAYGAVQLLVVGVATIYLFNSCSNVPNSTPQAPVASTVSEDVRQQCLALIDKARLAGLIRKEPSAYRIDVQDRLWAKVPADAKRSLLQAVSCREWSTATPPPDKYVVAYGHRSGRRVAMLTSYGIDYE